MKGDETGSSVFVDTLASENEADMTWQGFDHRKDWKSVLRRPHNVRKES